MEIAIDGYSACGKSTLAKALASEIGAVYIDTGAMYRAVTLYFLNHHIDINKEKEIRKALKSIDISFDTSNGKNDCMLNGVNVENEIRSQKVNQFVSQVAAISLVRRKLVSLQRNLSKGRNVVMDGRDIGTVVFPNAEFKFFITARPEIRAKRRLLEYESRGIFVEESEVLSNLLERDRIDSTRTDSPLRKADDAIIIDNSDMTRDDQLELVLSHIPGLPNEEQ